MPTRQEAKEWLAHPVTVALLSLLRSRYPVTEAIRVDSWEKVNLVKGRQEIIDLLTVAPDLFETEET